MSMSLKEIDEQFRPADGKAARSPLDELIKKYRPQERHEWTLKITQRMRTFVEADMFRPGRETMAPQMMKMYCDILSSLSSIDDEALRKMQLWKTRDEAVAPFVRRSIIRRAK